MAEEEFAMSMRAVENFLTSMAEDLAKSIIKAQEARRPAKLIEFIIERRDNCLAAKKVVIECRQSVTDL